MMEQTNIENIRTLTDKLTDWEPIHVETPKTLILKSEKGTVLLFGLLNTSEISVCKSFASAEAVLAEHCHEQREWIIVWSGEATVTINKDKFKLSVGEYICIEANVPHKVEWKVDTWMLGVTVPGNIHFPSANSNPYYEKESSNSWLEWGRHVLAELERLNVCSLELSQKSSNLSNEITALKVKAGIWGLFGGLLVPTIAFAIWMVERLVK